MRSTLSLRLPDRVHDDVIRRAQASNMTPTEWARRVVVSVLYKSQSGKGVPH
jgi:hypothetical protein